MGIFDYSKDDIPSLIERLKHEVKGHRRLAAGYMMQTEDGLKALRQLYQQNREIITNAFNLYPWQCLDDAREGSTQKVKYDLEAYQKISIPCPICNTLPENLTWIFFEALECPEVFFKDLTGWVSVCEVCHLQINRFNIGDTPAHARTKEYF
jgi:hypothetical protein